MSRRGPEAREEGLTMTMDTIMAAARVPVMPEAREMDTRATTVTKPVTTTKKPDQRTGPRPVTTAAVQPRARTAVP